MAWQFPDAVSLRGQKHLRELMNIKKADLHIATLLVVKREDVQQMRPASRIDKKFS